MFGKKRIHFDSIDSTNTYARQLIRDNRPSEGTVITADYQTAGRGRLDRRWTAQPASNLLASFVMYPQRPPDEWGGLPLLAGCAACEAIAVVSGLHPHVKWPNDVLIGTAKVCGVLVESGSLGEQGWAVTGIGINVNQLAFEGEFRLEPTSLAREAGRSFDLDTVLTTLCTSLDSLYRQWTDEGNAAVIARWKKLTRMLGRRISVMDGGESRSVTAIDIADDGALLVLTDEGLQESVRVGDVSILPEDETA
jgi:BirA family transcriptional regulator, biotin operon repressor / biotin---[acetyl-CoA-carboxylase] ligase